MRTRLLMLMTLALAVFATTASAQAITISSNAGNAGATAAGTSGRFPVGAVIDVSGTGFTGITSIGAGQAEIRFYDGSNNFVSSSAVSTGGWTITTGAGTFSGTVTIPNMGTGAAAAVKATVKVSSTGGINGVAESTVGSAVPADPTPVSASMAQPGNNAKIGATTSIILGDDFPNDSDVLSQVVEFLHSDTTWHAVSGANVSGAWVPGTGATLVVDLGAEDSNADGYIEELVGAVANGSVSMRVRITDTGNNVTTVGPRTNLTVDTRAPRVTKIETTDTNITGNVGSSNSNTSTIEVTFDEDMDGATMVAGNFNSNSGGVSNVVYNGATKVATLTITPAFLANETPTITVASGAKDPAGNSVDAGYKNATAAVDKIKPQLQGAFLNTNTKKLSLVFDEAMGSPAGYSDAHFDFLGGTGNPGPAIPNVAPGNITLGTTNSITNNTLIIDLSAGVFTLDEGNTVAPKVTVLDAATVPNGAEITPFVSIVLLPTLDMVTYDAEAHNLVLTFSKDISRTTLANNLNKISLVDNTGGNVIALANAGSIAFTAGNALITTVGNSATMSITLNAELDEKIHGALDGQYNKIFRVQVAAASGITDTNSAVVLTTVAPGVLVTMLTDDTTAPTLTSATQNKDPLSNGALDGTVVDLVFDDYIRLADAVNTSLYPLATGPNNVGHTPVSATRANDGKTVRLTYSATAVANRGVDLDLLDGSTPADQLNIGAINDTAGNMLAGALTVITNVAAVTSTKTMLATPAGANLNVAATTATAAKVATLRLADLGGDTFPTIVGGNIVFTLTGGAAPAGTFKPMEHTWTLTGGTLPAAGVTATVGAAALPTTLTFDISGSPQTIASSGTLDLDVNVKFNTSGTTSTDGSTFRVELRATDSDIVSAGGSTFVASAADTSAGTFVYDIQATHLRPHIVFGTASGVATSGFTIGTKLDSSVAIADQKVGAAAANTLEIQFVDQNGLIDIDANNAASLVTVTPSAVSGTATPASFTNLAGELVAGVLTMPAATFTFTTHVLKDVTYSVASTYNPSGLGVVTGFDLTDKFDVTPDTDSTLVQQNSPATWDASAGGEKELVSYTIQDVGPTDGLPTVVSGLAATITMGGSTTLTHADFKYRLHWDNDMAVFAASDGDVLGVVAGNVVTFSALGVSVANNTSGSMRITIEHNNLTDKADLDQVTWDVKIAETTGALETNGPLTAPLDSSTITSAALDNTNNTAAQVVSTKMRFTTEPTADQQFVMGAAIPLVVEFVDNNGNRDLDRDGVGSAIQVGDDSDMSNDGIDTNNSLSANTANPSMGVATVSPKANFPYSAGVFQPGRLDTKFSVSTTAADPAHEVITTANSFDIRATDDKNSTLVASTVGISATNVAISSVSATVTPIWEFTLSDLGTSDDKPTILTTAQFSLSNLLLNGSNDADDFIWTLLDGSNSTVYTGVTSGTTITFNSMTISTGTEDTTTKTVLITLSVQAKTTVASPASFDGMNFEIALSTYLTAGGTSTSLTSAAAITRLGSADMNVTVVNTKLTVGAVGDPQEAGTALAFNVMYEDANGNRDLDQAGASDLAVTRSDGGTITGGPFTPVAGVAAVSITMKNPAVLNPTKIHLNLNSTAVAAGTPDAVTGDFSLNPKAEVTLAVGAGAETDAISSVAGGQINVLDFKLTDGGVDGIAGEVNTVTIRRDALSNADMRDANWALYDGASDIATILGNTLTATSDLAFTGMTSTIADGGSKTYTLRMTLVVPASIGTFKVGHNTTDGQRWVFKVTEADIGVAATGSQKFGGPSSISNNPNAALTAGIFFRVVATAMVPINGTGDRLVVDNATAGNFNSLLVSGAEVGVAAQGWSNTGIGAPIRFRYEDANGNTDLDGGDTITITHAGNPVTTSAANVSGVVTFATAQLTVANIGGALVFTDDAGGAINAAVVTVDHFDAYAVTDSNSIINQLSNPLNASISATTAQEIWSFKVDEVAGATDNKHTSLDKIDMVAVSSVGSISTNDFVWIATVGTTDYTGTVAGNTITFDFPAAGVGDDVTAASGVTPTAMSVNRLASGMASISSSDAIKIKIMGKATTPSKELVDGMMFTGIQVQNAVYNSPSTSSTIGNLPFAKTIPTITLDVTADRIGIASGNAVAGSTWSGGYAGPRTYTVEYTDVWGYRDLGITTAVSATRADSGNFWIDASHPRSTSVTSPAAAAGLATFTNLMVSAPAVASTTATFATAAVLATSNTVTSNTFAVAAVNEATVVAGLAAMLQISSISVAETDVYGVKVRDSNGDGWGTEESDSFSTYFTALAFDTATSTANFADGTWRLKTDPADVLIATGVYNSGTKLLTFGPFAAQQVPDDGEIAYKVTFQLNAGAHTTLDNAHWDLSIGTPGLTIDAGVPNVSLTSGKTGFGAIANGAGLKLDVVSTELRFDTSAPAASPATTTLPPTSAKVAATLDSFKILHTDANGSIDANRTDNVTMTWSGAGAVTGGVVAAASGEATFGAAKIAAPGILGGTLTWNTAAGHAAITRAFDLNADPDANSTLGTGATNALTLSSDANVDVPVWTIDVTDLGTSDHFPTVINNVTITFTGAVMGGNLLTDFVYKLNGVPAVPSVVGVNGTLTFTGLSVNVADLSTATTADGAGAITVTGAASSNNPAGAELTLTIMVKPTVTAPDALDHMQLQNFQVTAATSATPLVHSQIAGLPLVKTNAVTVDVVAKHVENIGVIGNQVGGVGFAVQVEYNDNNHNRDLDIGAGYTAKVARNDTPTAGVITNVVSGVAVSGVANFANIILGYPGFEAGSLIFNDSSQAGLTASVVAQTSPDKFNLIGVDELTTNTATAGEAPTISSITTTKVLLLDFNLIDGGTDLMQSDIKSITYNFTGATTYNVAQGVFTLEVAGLGTPLVQRVAEGATSITFNFPLPGAVDALAIPNSSQKTVALKFEPLTINGVAGTGNAASKNLGADPGPGITTPTVDQNTIAVQMVPANDIKLHFATKIDAAPTLSASVLSGSTLSAGAITAQHTATYEVATSTFAMVQQPALTGQAGAKFATVAAPVRVKTTDVYGNIDTNFGAGVTIASLTKDSTPVNPASPLFTTSTITVNDLDSDGIYIFDNLRLDTAGVYTFDLAPSAGPVPAPITTNSITISPGPKDRFVITAQPAASTIAGVALTTTLQLQDAYGNNVNEAVSVVASITPGTDPLTNGAATLLTGSSLTQSSSAANGLYTYNDMSIQKAGVGFGLRFTASTLPTSTVDSNVFTITHAAASKISIEAQPAALSDTVAGVLFSAGVQVRDQYDNPAITGAQSNITVATNVASGITNVPVGLTKVTVAGAVTFSNLKITKAGTYALTFASDAGGIANATGANSFNIVPDVPHHMVAVTQPAVAQNVVAGAAIPFKVELEDQFNNKVTTPPTPISITVSTMAPGFAATSTTNVNANAASLGTADFTNIAIEKAASGYQITANAAALATPNFVSNSFNVVAAAAHHFVVTTQPTVGPHTAGAGTIGLTLQTQDVYNNNKAQSGINALVAILNDPMTNGAAALFGTATQATDASGIATFTGLSIRKAGVGFTLRASTGSFAATVDTTGFDVKHDVPAAITVATQPTVNQQIVAGTPFSASILLRDQYGNPTTSESGTNVTVDTVVAGKLVNTPIEKTVATANGVATYGSLRITAAGTYTLAFSSGVLTAPTGLNSFTIVHDVPHHMVVVSQPTPGQDIAAGDNIGFSVKLQDQYNNDANNPVTPVNVSVSTTAPGFSGTSTTNVQANAGNSGVADFAAIDIEKAANGYQITASGAGLMSPTVVSNAFDIVAAAAHHYVVTAQPAVGPHTAGATTIGATLQLQDEFNNNKLSNGVPANIALQSDPGTNGAATLFGSLTQSTDAVGVVVFSGLSIQKAGDGFTLRISSGSLSTTVDTSAFNVQNDVPATITVTTQPTATVTAGSTFSTAIQLYDQYGNPAKAGGAQVVTVDTNPGSRFNGGSATVIGTTAGAAIFPGLRITVADSYNLVFSVGALPTANSNNFSVVAAAADHFAITGQPAVGPHVAGASTIAMSVQVQDVFNNNRSEAGIPATIEVSNLGSPTLGGTLFKSTAANGTIDFTGHDIKVAATGYTLRVDSTHPTIGPVTSTLFNVMHAAASKMFITSQPSVAQNIVAGTTFNSSIEIRDQYDNRVDTGAQPTVTVDTVAGGFFTNGIGDTQKTAVNGTINFLGLRITKTGSYRLAFTSGALSQEPAAANTFNVVPDVPHHLAVVSQPATNQDVVAGTNIPFGVDLEDQFNNKVTNPPLTVNVNLSTNMGPFKTGSTTSVPANAASSGAANFTNIQLTTAQDNYIITATGSGLAVPAVQSNLFDIVAAAGDHFVITSQPTGGPHEAGQGTIEVTMQLKDQYDNNRSQNGVSATVALLANPGSASFIAPGSLTTTTDNAGVARFTAANSNAIALDKTGTGYTLAITGVDGASLPAVTGSNPVVTSTFNVKHTTPDHFAITSQPAASYVAGVAGIAVSAELLDIYENRCITPAVPVTATVDTVTPAGRITSGTTSLGVSAGLVSFSSLRINVANTSAVDTYQLVVSGGGATSATSSAFNVAPAAVASLSIVTHPGNGTGGAPLSVQPIINTFDAFNNFAWNDNTTPLGASIGTNAGQNDNNVVDNSGVLDGNDVVAVGGVGTFTDLSINRKGTGYTLNFAVVGNGAINIGPSSAFNITVGNVASLEMLQQPAGLKAGRPLTTQPSVRGRDAGGNLVSAVAVDVQARLAMTVPSGVIIGVGTLGDAQPTLNTQVGTGVALFSNLQINAISAELPAMFSIEFFVPSNLTVASTTSNAFQLILGTILTGIQLDDHDKNNAVSANDEIYFTFDEAVNPVSIPADNVGNALDMAFGLVGGAQTPTFGTGATASAHPTDATVVIVRVGAGAALMAGVTTSDPSINAVITDANGNPDVTPTPVALADGTTDVFAPTVESMTLNRTLAKVGDTVTIVVTYSDVQTVAPVFTLTRPTVGPLQLTAVAGVAPARTFTYDFVVQPHNGTTTFDGVYTFNFSGENNGNNPGVFVFNDSTTAAKTFTVDTRTPIFGAVRVMKVVLGVPTVSNLFKDGDDMILEVDLQNETALAPSTSVTADLSLLGGNATTTFTQAMNGTYSSGLLTVSSGGVSANLLPLTMMVSDVAGNMAAYGVAIKLDNVAPQPVLTYDAPANMVTEGDLVITAQFFEDVSTPDMEVIFPTGTSLAGPTAMTPLGARTFTMMVTIPTGLTGTGTVSISGAKDLVGNSVVQANPNTFEVVASAAVLRANAGPDQNLTSLAKVLLSGSASVGANGPTAFEWSVQDPDGNDATSLLNGNTTSASTSMMPMVPGTYTAKLTVRNTAGGEAFDYVNITVPNILPVVALTEVITVSSTEVITDEDNSLLTRANFTLEATAFDANEANFVPSQIQWVPGAANTGNLSIKPSTANSMTTQLLVGGSEITGGVYTFDVLVFDSIGVLNNTPTRKTVEVRVVSGTVVPPVALIIGSATVAEGTTTNLIGHLSNDPNGTITAYNWTIVSGPAGANFSDPTAADPIFTPGGVGVYNLSLTVTDDEMLSSTATFTISVIEGDDQNPATIENTFPRTVVKVTHEDNEVVGNEVINVGEEVTMDASATVDPDGDALTFLWEQRSGPVVQLATPTAAIQVFTPTATGTYTFWVSAKDLNNNGIGRLVNVQVSALGNAKVVARAEIAASDGSDNRIAIYDTGTGKGVDGNGSNTMINLTAAGSTTDAAGGITSYRWTQVFGPTAQLSGIQSSAAAFWPVDAAGNVVMGAYVFRVLVKDSNDVSASAIVTVIVEEFDSIGNPTGRSVPTVVAGDKQGNVEVTTTSGVLTNLFGSDSTDADGNGGAALEIHWTQTDGPAAILDFSASQSNPTFTGLIPGVYVFNVVAEDAQGNVSETKTVTITVNAPVADSGGSSCALNATNSGFGGLLLLLLSALAIVAIRRRKEANA